MKLTKEWFVQELQRWKTGEWCTICDAPLYQLPDGEHWCETISTLQDYRFRQSEEIIKLKAALKQVDHYLNILSSQKDISDKDIAFKMARATLEKVLYG